MTHYALKLMEQSNAASLAGNRATAAALADMLRIELARKEPRRSYGNTQVQDFADFLAVESANQRAIVAAELRSWVQPKHLQVS
jgi:hypothetical protein